MKYRLILLIILILKKESIGTKCKEIISDLSELFSQACINRCNNGNNLNLIALTGGMGSRTIAACMAKNKIPFQTTRWFSK